MGVDKSGLVTGRVDAITPLEQFEPVWQGSEFLLLRRLDPPFYV